MSPVNITNHMVIRLLERKKNLSFHNGYVEWQNRMYIINAFFFFINSHAINPQICH